jgi:Bacteriophage tail sheath protein
MDGLSFVAAPPPVGSDPARADIACFVGFIARRAGDLAAERRKLEAALESLRWEGPDLPASTRLIPADVVPAGISSHSFVSWLKNIGWKASEIAKGTPDPQAVPEPELFRELLNVWLPPTIVEWWREDGYLNATGSVSAVDLLELRDVPVPTDTWDVFDALFAWEARLLDCSGRQCAGLLGAAVRGFFGQGGRKCYVVRLGPALPVFTRTPARRRNAAAFLPMVPPPVAVDRSSWRGIGHLFGLPDVSFLCLPDLPELFAVTPNTRPLPSPPPFPEEFKECAEGADPPATGALRGIPAPRCDEEGFREWSILVRRIGEFLRGSAREVQFVAAIPLPVDTATLAGQPGAAGRVRAANEAQWTYAAQIQTAFVQLGYPWLRTRDSVALPGGVEPPDGVLAGLLANSALTRGSWRSAIRQPVPGISNVEPVLDRATLQRNLPLTNTPRFPLVVRDRVTVIGPSPGGFRLLSDVTTDDDEAYRPANVNRLVSAIVRAARVTGETAVFQNNGEALWRRLRESMEGLLAGLWADGALAGEYAAEAFEVRCDRSTITQSDLDAGRVLCRISFTAASPIVDVTVVLAMDEGGNVSLASRQPFAAPQSQAA